MGPFQINSFECLWRRLSLALSKKERSLNTWSFLLCCCGGLKYGGLGVGGGGWAGMSPVCSWQWGTLTNWRNPVQKSEQPPATSTKKIFLLFHLHPLSTLREPPQQGPCGELVSVVIILTPASTEDGCCSLWGGKWSSARRKTQTQHRDFEKEIKEALYRCIEKSMCHCSWKCNRFVTLTGVARCQIKNTGRLLNVGCLQFRFVKRAMW